jgi:hypothetical protein
MNDPVVSSADLRRVLVRSALALATLALAACHSMTGSSSIVGDGVWGSNDAVLDVNGATATLRIFNSGICYGQFGQVDESIPRGEFDLPGSFTQLIGTPPGHLDYSADFTGAVSGDRVSIRVTVPATQQVYGPFELRQGVSRAGGACLYP